MIAVVKYNAGNIRSMTNALRRLQCDPVVTNDPDTLRSADKVIFPGVGEASTAMAYLREKGIDDVLRKLHQPFLGVCLGLQLMCSFSEEGNTECLGIFPERVKRFPPENKVPHMGWNSIEFDGNILFNGLEKGVDMYFVHSYYAELSNDTSATTEYILKFSSALHRDNFHAVQFHPEKSAAPGEQIIKNFLEL